MYYNNEFCNLYYEKYGNKKDTLIILPGWGDNRNTFHHIIDYFKNKFTIYIFDYPGFGKSSTPIKEMTIYDYATMINNFIEKFTIENPIILSHSFGGRISILLSTIYKKNIKKHIFIDIAGIKPKKNLKQLLKQTIYKIKRKISKLIKNNEKRETYINNLRKKYSSTDYLLLPKNMHQTFKNIVNENLKKYIKYIKQETLILWGENDIDTPIKDGIYLNKKIKDSALIILPKAGHFSYIEYKDLTISIIEKFILE